ncbi:MAG: flagellar basal body-associated FliL family protein [Polaromonas sp.]|nr:flagellar basal body-associated FliL family protein [Polaromonas sp.]
MVDEVVEAEPKPKKPILLIVGGIVVLLLLVVGAVVGTLFATGFFKAKPVLTAEQMLEGDSHGAAASGADTHGAPAKAGGKDAAPTKQTKKSPELTRFDYSYLKLENDFLSNLSGSRKVMSVQIAIMTRYDKRVIDNVKKHEMALRSVILDVMRQTVEADLLKPDFRKELAVRIRDAMNTLLEKYEDFGGIEEVYFTTFVTQ